MPSVTVAPRASAAAVRLSVACMLLLGGCKTVRDFLVPPQSATSLQAQQRANRAWADAVLRHATFKGHQDVNVVLQRGKILAIGSEREIAKHIGPGTLLRDVRAGWLEPGLVDSHVHLDGMAMLPDAVDLSSAESAAAAIETIKAAKNLTTGGWQWATGARAGLLKQLDASALDQAMPGHPVWISGADGHASVLSESLVRRLPKALRQHIMTAKGHVDGHMARASWLALPLPSPARASPMLLQGVSAMLRQGYTSAHTMGVNLGFLQLLVDLERMGRMPMRVAVYLDAQAPAIRAYISERAARRRPRKPGEKHHVRQHLPDDASQKVSVKGIKIWLDGTLGAHTAALGAAYADGAKDGQLLLDEDAVAATLHDVDAAGLQLAVHAIGDKAVALVAKVLRAAKRPSDAQPVRIEHAQVVSPETLKSLQGLRCVCAIQPLHELEDASFAAKRLGATRMGWGYRAGTLAKVCPISIGSDLPVAQSDPWRAWKHVCMTKTGHEALPADKGWLALSRDVSTGAVRKIAVGEPADLVLWKTKPRVDKPRPVRLLTIVDGETIFASPELPKAQVAPRIPSM